MIDQRPGQKIFIVPGPSWGVRVIEPAAMAADWWDPDNEGLSVVGAYRAINSVGTPWPGGPGVYADSLVNQANPGVNDLVEGNGAVPWAEATGWGFVQAAAQYFLTGLIPANDQSWSMLAQFDNFAGIWTNLLGCVNVGATWFFLQPLRAPPAVTYGNGWVNIVAPDHLTGNLGVAGDQPYRDGIAEGGPLGPWAAPSLFDIYIGCRNNAGVPAGHPTVDFHAAVFYDATLTAPQMLAVATAMAAL